jgi:hypothetical protein
MRSIVALLLVVCASFVVARAARAGAFSPPVNTNACGEADVAGDAMQDPNTAYIFADTPEHCAKLCTAAGKLCRVYVNDVFACTMRVLANTRTFGKLNCESITSNPEDEKLCKSNTISSVAGSIAIARGQRTASLLGCASWADTCRASCVP